MSDRYLGFKTHCISFPRQPEWSPWTAGQHGPVRTTPHPSFMSGNVISGEREMMQQKYEAEQRAKREIQLEKEIRERIEREKEEQELQLAIQQSKEQSISPPPPALTNIMHILYDNVANNFYCQGVLSEKEKTEQLMTEIQKLKDEKHTMEKSMLEQQIKNLNKVIEESQMLGDKHTMETNILKQQIEELKREVDESQKRLPFNKNRRFRNPPSNINRGKDHRKKYDRNSYD